MATDLIRKLADAIAPVQTRAIDKLPVGALEERVAALRSARGARRRARRRRAFLVTGAFSAAAAAAVALMARPRPLQFMVGDQRGIVGQRLEASAVRPLAIQFSDGTEIALGAHASGRVLALGSDGAQLVLDRGALRATVTPRRASTWLVAVGPFDVRVKGTRFDAAWDPKRERFSLAMYEGVVTITGRCLAAPRTSSAGDRIEIPCPSPATEPAAAALDRGAAVASGAEDAPVRHERPAIATPRAEAGARAPGPGLDAACARGSEAELMQMGAVARATTDRVAAMRIYGAVRSRFAGSDSAAVAAFHLGQVAFDQGGSLTEARAGFETYLRERPEGSLAPEALGRLLEIAQRAGAPAAAAADARRYLERFPRGPHAALARALVGQ